MSELGDIMRNDMIVKFAQMHGALLIIRGFECESFTSGLGSCFRNDRTPEAYYGAERCCHACIAWKALGGIP